MPILKYRDTFSTSTVLFRTTTWCYRKLHLIILNLAIDIGHVLLYQIIWSYQLYLTCCDFCFCYLAASLKGPLKHLRILVSVCAGIFNFVSLFAMKQCPIAAKIAGSIGILLCCVLDNFFTSRGMNICPICEASLSHHTMYMGYLFPAYTCTVNTGLKDLFLQSAEFFVILMY